MSFEQYEESIDSAQPVVLLQFTLGSRVWRFASCATDVVTQDGKVWMAEAITASSVRQTGDPGSDVLTIEMPAYTGPVQTFIISPPTRRVEVIIFAKDAVDNELVTLYVGEVSQVNFPQPNKAALSCEALSVSMSREGLRLGWQRSCPFALYDPATCKINKTAYAVPATITAISGFDITVSTALTGGIYPGGFFEWTHPVKGAEFRAIESQNGSVLRVFGSTLDLYVGLAITLYRGCDRTPATCRTFGNYNNYGGVPLMPGKSPFDGTPVF